MVVFLFLGFERMLMLVVGFRLALFKGSYWVL